MKTIDFSYFIERYNVGEMDLTEKRWFEKELEGNETLKREVHLRKKVDNALLQHDLISLRNKLATLEKDRKEKVIADAGKRTTGIRYAAAFAGMMLIGSVLLMNFRSQDPVQLFKQGFSGYEFQGTTRTTVVKADVAYDNALSLYEKKEYSQANVFFSQYLKNNPGNMEAQFLNGISLMETGNFNAAIVSLKTVLENSNNLFIDIAQFNLALCYLAKSDMEEARQQLVAIKNSDSHYKKQAKRYLRQL